MKAIYLGQKGTDAQMLKLNPEKGVFINELYSVNILLGGRIFLEIMILNIKIHQCILIFGYVNKYFDRSTEVVRLENGLAESKSHEIA